jgi:hypothetical protein
VTFGAAEKKSRDREGLENIERMAENKDFT